MNLRQKVKQAKKELGELDKKYPGNHTYDIYCRFMEEERLKTIINYKRKPDRYFNWNEKYKVDMNKLTYVDFRADGNTLRSFYHSNRKIITQKELQEFYKEVTLKLRGYAEYISKLDTNKENGEYITYYISVSNDSKKPRRLHMMKKKYRQYIGDSNIYIVDEN